MTQNRNSQLDFSLGIIRDVAPAQIDDRGAYDIVNAFLEKDGSPFKRGGTDNVTTEAFGETGIRFMWEGLLGPGRRTLVANRDGFGVVDADRSVLGLGGAGMRYPKSAALIEGLLFIGGGWIYAGSRKSSAYFTGSMTLVQGSRDVVGIGTDWSNADAGMMLQIGLDGRLYVVESVGDGQHLRLRDAWEGATVTTGYTLWPLYRITDLDPYEESEFYTVCANRLVRASGTKVRFSEILKPHDQSVTIEGQEITNEHELDDPGAITGLGSVNNSVLIFATGGSWVLDGLAVSIVDAAGNPQHRVQNLSRELVLAGGAAAIASWSRALICPCTDGIYLIDGVSAPRRISGAIDELYRTYVERGYRFGEAVVYRGHYLLPVLTAAGSRAKDVLVAKLDRPIESNGRTVFPWTRLAGSGAKISAFQVKRAGDGAEVGLLGAELYDHSRVVDCAGYFAPESSGPLDADETIPRFVIVTRDYETGQLTENMVRAIETRYELAGDDATIEFDYALGDHDDASVLWDESDWASNVADPDDLVWGDEEDGVFTDLEHPGEESDGRPLHRCEVNEYARYIRFRVRGETACNELRFRSLTLVTRPSNALRR